MKKLEKKGIRTTVHYKPLHRFTVIKKYAKRIDSLKNSKQAYNEMISLPLFLDLTRSQIDYVVKNIEK